MGANTKNSFQKQHETRQNNTSPKNRP